MLFDRTLGAHDCFHTAHYRSEGRQPPCIRASVLQRHVDDRTGFVIVSSHPSEGTAPNLDFKWKKQEER